MARRHSADDDLAGALAILNTIEAEVAIWAADNAEPARAEPENDAPDILPPDDADRDDAGRDNAGRDNAGLEPLEAKDDGLAAEPLAEIAPAVVPEADKAAADALATSVDSAAAATSPLPRLARDLDAEIDRIIAQASDTEILSFSEKLLRRLRLARIPQDVRRRDGVLTALLVTSLERAATLLAALDAHRKGMKSLLPRLEDDLTMRIEQAKSMDDETIASDTAHLANRQDVVEAIIRHEANTNSLRHKLVIEIERGIVVMRALAGGQELPLAAHFSADAQAVLSHVLTLSEKNMLSMREVERRKHGIDEGFRHRFNLTPVPRASTAQPQQTEQASA